MCLIIYKPKESKTIITLDHIIRGFTTNPHGFGFYFKSDDATVYHKFVPLSIDDLINYYYGCGFFDIQKDAEIVVHFRAGTRGTIKHVNCHPFDIGEGWLLFHNGFITGFGDDTESDTNLFAAHLRESLKGKINALVEDGELKNVISKDTWNKFVLVSTQTNDKAIVIDPTNESVYGAGWHNKLWYSSRRFINKYTYV